MFKTKWPNLKYLDLWGTSVLETDVEFLCLACNGSKKTLPNLVSLGLTIPGFKWADHYWNKLVKLPWLNLRSLYLDGEFGSYNGFANAVNEKKLQNLTYFGIETNIQSRKRMIVNVPSFDKLINLQCHTMDTA